MPKNDEELSFDPSIDPLRLDQEWLLQPRMYYEWATRLAQAKREVDEAKQEMEVTAAELGLAIRSDPVRFDLPKVTEDTVKAAIQMQPQYEMALTAYNEARHRADVIAAAVHALDHRRRALENLVDLHGMNYFSTPRTDHGTEAMAGVEKRAARGRARMEEGDY